MSTLSIPPSWDDFTPDWINAALAPHHPGAKVSDVRIVWRNDGTNRRARLGLTYAQGKGPETLFIKAEDPAHNDVHVRNGALFCEAQLFSSNAPLGLDHPFAYVSLFDKQNNSFLLVMEDIAKRGGEPRDALRPLSVDEVANGLRALARMHSIYWGFTDQSHPHLAWVEVWSPERWAIGLNRRMPLAFQRAAAMLPSQVLVLGEKGVVDIWSRYVSSLSCGPMTLLHGDAHIGNVYTLPNDQVGFLDWQVTRRGDWSQDVGYFLVGSLTVDERRKHDAELIEIYRQALEAPDGQKPSREQAWLRYRGTPVYGQAIWLSTLGTDGWQSQEICLALVERYAAAYVELGSTEALAAIGA